MGEDALSALQAAVQSQSSITPVDVSGVATSLRDATQLRLSSTVSLPKSTPTRLRKPGTTSGDPEASPDDFFHLGAVYLAWHLRDASGAEYMKQARDSGLAVGFVSVTERKGIVEWLEGKVTNLANIVPVGGSTTPPGTPGPAAYFRSTTSTVTSSSHSRHGHGHASASAPFSSSSSKRRHVPDPADIEVVKKIKQNEVELRDRNTVLRGIKPNNFTSIRNVYTAKLKSLKDAKKPGAAPVSAPPTPDPVMQARRQKNKYPIIMISSSPTSLITMHNVRRFLQDAIFEPSAEARARAAAEGNTRPEDLIPIYRNRTTIDSSGRETASSQRYYVVDSVEALNKFGTDAWDRVVCVITTGQAWQFRPYKWTEPRSLFHHVKGIYVSWTNDPPNTKIKDWNVTELKIDPHRRHVDKSTVAHFWKTLDTWTMHNKPSLMKT